MTVRGIPDCSRAARIILKNYVNGKLLYCHAPPTVSQEEFQATTVSRGHVQAGVHDMENPDEDAQEPEHRRVC